MGNKNKAAIETLDGIRKRVNGFNVPGDWSAHPEVAGWAAPSKGLFMPVVMLGQHAISFAPVLLPPAPGNRMEVQALLHWLTPS